MIRTVPPAASINAAIAMSAPGDFVEPRGSGTHSGGIRVDRPGVTVIGANPDVEVRGQVYATPGGADGRVTGLRLINGGNTARVNPAIDAARFRLDHNRIDNEDFGIAVHIGATGVQAVDVVVEFNVIGDVGRKPWTNYDHGTYLRNTLRAVVRENTYLDGGDYAFHFWGPAIGTIIERNVVLGGWAGAVIFGGNSGGWSRGTRMRRNILVGPPRSGRTVVYEYWDGVSAADIAAADNLVDDNIVVASSAAAAVLASPRGFRHTGTKVLTASPLSRSGDVVKIVDPVADGYGPASIQRTTTPPPPDPDPVDPCRAIKDELSAKETDLAAALIGRGVAESDRDAARAERDQALASLAVVVAARDEARDSLAEALADLAAVEDDLRKIRGSAGSPAGKAADRLRGIKGRSQKALDRLGD